MTLHLHYWPTPNGRKVAIFLEEVELAYDLIPCNIGRGDQFEPEFVKLNPNTRMPVLVDDEPPGGGGPISVFEQQSRQMRSAHTDFASDQVRE